MLEALEELECSGPARYPPTAACRGERVPWYIEEMAGDQPQPPQPWSYPSWEDVSENPNYWNLDEPPIWPPRIPDGCQDRRSTTAAFHELICSRDLRY